MPSLTSVENALKVVAANKTLKTQWIDENKILDWMPKKEDFYGRHQELSVGYGPGGGRSHTFGVSQDQSNNGRKYALFTQTRARDYGTLYIDNEAIEASEKGDAAWLETHAAELKGLTVKLGQTLGWQVIEDGYGVIDNIAAGGISGNIITLAVKNSIFKIEVGDQLEVYNPAGSHPSKTKRGGPVGYLTVTARGEQAGTITVSNIADVTGVTAADHLVHRGDYNLGVTGIRRWVPFTAAEFAASTSLLGFDRIPDPARLAGRRYDATAGSLTGGLEAALSQGSRAGVKYTHLWVNDDYFTALSMEAGARLVESKKPTAEWGYSGFDFRTSRGLVPVHCERNLGEFALALSRESWEFKFLKKPMRYLTEGKSIVKQSADGIEVRYGWRGNVFCVSPGDNLVCALPSITL